MKILNILKGVVGNINREFDSNSMILLSEYEDIQRDDNVRMDRFKASLKSFVESKARMGYKTCTYDIPIDLQSYKDDILEWLRSLGFDVLDEGEYSYAFQGSIGISWRLWKEKSASSRDAAQSPHNKCK